MTVQSYPGVSVLLPSPAVALTVTHHDEGPVWVMSLVGEADISNRDGLLEGLTHALSMKRDVVVVDVSGLEFCDGGCVATVLDANSDPHVSNLVLVGAHGVVRRIFDLLDPHGALARHA